MTILKIINNLVLRKKKSKKTLKEFSKILPLPLFYNVTIII